MGSKSELIRLYFGAHSSGRSYDGKEWTNSCCKLLDIGMQFDIHDLAKIVHLRLTIGPLLRTALPFCLHLNK